MFTARTTNGEQNISARRASKRERGIYLQQVDQQKAACSLTRIAKREAVGDDSRIELSDIPELPAEQLRKARPAPKVLVAARLDRDVYDWLQDTERATQRE